MVWIAFWYLKWQAEVDLECGWEGLEELEVVILCSFYRIVAVFASTSCIIAFRDMIFFSFLLM